MKNHFEKLLDSFGFESWAGLLSSLFPSTKYYLMSPLAVILSSVSVGIQLVFGLNVTGFVAFLFVMMAELTVGVLASLYKRESFSSNKLSRFTIKAGVYLTLIYVSQAMMVNFKEGGNILASAVFEWIHVFFVFQIVIENMVSILESLAVISGKDKTHWIRKIQDKVSDFLFG